MYSGECLVVVPWRTWLQIVVGLGYPAPSKRVPTFLLGLMKSPLFTKYMLYTATVNHYYSCAAVSTRS